MGRKKTLFVVSCSGVKAGFMTVEAETWTDALRKGLRRLELDPSRLRDVDEVVITKRGTP